MSKHPSNETKSRMLRRGLAGILSLALILGLFPSTFITAHAASWADSYVQTLVDWGVMRGDVSGNMDSDRAITRAEFVTLMNRAYGYTNLGGHPFTDVGVRDWYNEDIDIAYNIGYFKGTSATTAAPNASLTREQAAVLLSRNMMLQPTVGETLGFSDTRTLNDWSRGLVGAAAANGIISGYEDGSFQPMRNISRGEVAAMLVRAIGTPIQEEGDYALGNVYGNVTVNTSGVKLRDGVIAGNLYLTGGIDLGEVLLENVTVLGEIIVSGGGESNSSESSIVLRNVVADNMVVDSISDQFVTIRAEGNTDVPTTTVRTNAYVDDSSLPGYGLSYIELDGDPGTRLQLAGNVKEVWDRTPNSDLQIVQGSADKVTVDEHATGSSVLVDGDARVEDLNLDVATNVTGTGDIKNLNVGAAGSTVEQLPDNIEIRPGITTDINGSNMNSSQAAQSSADPRLLAGYPAVRKIAPTSAELVFRTNKPGTIYWAVSAVTDGSVSEADLMEPPVYGNKILASGTINATAANTDYTAAVSRLTRDGSYYVTAMLVDGRDQHSPIKVTSFSTPDDTTPAFITPYPYMSKNTCDLSQVTVMTNKSCQLYYALLPMGATAPTAAEFKAGASAIPGNWGYGTQSVTKSVATSINVNVRPLDEETGYSLYLWLTDYDGAKSSTVRRLDFTTPDETPPVVTNIEQTGEGVRTITIRFTISEPGSLIWALVSEPNHASKQFLPWTEDNFLPNDTERSILGFRDAAALQAARVKLEGGTGAVASGIYNSRGTANTGTGTITVPQEEAEKNTSYVLYYMGDDNETATGNLSEEIKAYRVHLYDGVPPTVTQHFTDYDGDDDTKNPKSTTGVRLVFSEGVQSGTDKSKVFYNMYQEVADARTALNADPTSAALKADYETKRTALGEELAKCITLYRVEGSRNTPMTPRTSDLDTSDWTVDFRNAQVRIPEDGVGVEVFLPHAGEPADNPTGEPEKIDQLELKTSALNLDSGATYFFRLSSNTTTGAIFDLSPSLNRMPRTDLDPFTTSLARVLLQNGSEGVQSIRYATDNGSPIDFSTKGTAEEREANNPQRADFVFQMIPENVENMDSRQYWDMIFWFDDHVDFTLYSRPINEQGLPVKEDGTPYSEDDAPNAPWELERTQGGTGADHLFITQNHYKSYIRNYRTPSGAIEIPYDRVRNMLDPVTEGQTHPKKEMREYAIHLNSVENDTRETAWRSNITMRVAVISGSGGNNQLPTLLEGTLTSPDAPVVTADSGMTAIEFKQPFTLLKEIQASRPPQLESLRLNDRTDSEIDVTAYLDQRGGYLYYMAIPMDIYNAAGQTIGGPQGVELQENILYGITGNADENTNKATNDTPQYGPAVPISADPANIQGANAAKPSLPDLKNIPLMDNDQNKLSGEDYPTQDGTSTPPTVGKRVYLPNHVDFGAASLASYRLITGFVDGVVGPSATEHGPMPFNISGLQANTAYLLCVAAVPKDRNSNAPSTPSETSVFQCFRFTTNQFDLPTLEVQSADWVNVNVTDTSGKKALLEFFVVPQEDLNKAQGTNGRKFDDEFKADEGTTEGLAKDDFKDFQTKHGMEPPKTVQEAMALRLYDYNNGNKFLGTAFDLYAKEDIKIDYVGLVRSLSSTDRGVRPVWSSVTLSAQERPLLNLDNGAASTFNTGPYISGMTCTFVAIAHREGSSDFAFGLWNPLEQDTGSAPWLQSADLEGVVEQMKGADGTTNIGVKSAQIRLSFGGGGLYAYKNGKAVPIDNCKAGATGHNAAAYGNVDDPDYYSIGHAGTGGGSYITIVGDDSHPSTAPTAVTSVLLNIADLRGTRNITLFVSGDYQTITDEEGRKGTLRKDGLRISIRAVNVNANTPGEPAEYAPEIITENVSVIVRQNGDIISGWVEPGGAWNNTVVGP